MIATNSQRIIKYCLETEFLWGIVTLFGKKPLEINLLGVPRLQINGADVTFDSSLTLCLFCYLVVGRDHAHSREKLAALFWPERDTKSARHSLSQALYILRRTLGDFATSHLIANRVSVQFVLTDATALDIADVEGLTSDLDNASLVRLKLAEELSSKTMVEGLVSKGLALDDWLQEQRSRFEHVHILILRALCKATAMSNHYADTMIYASKLLNHVPMDMDGSYWYVCALLAIKGYDEAFDWYRAYAEHLDMPTDAERQNLSRIERVLQAGSMHRRTPVQRFGDRESRNKGALLASVESQWINGVLKASHGKACFVDLTITVRHDASYPASFDSSDDLSRMQEGISAASLAERLDEYESRLLILGESGSGKTTLLLRIAQILIQRAAGVPGRVPVILQLTHWTEGKLPLEEWIIEELRNKYHVPGRIGQKWVIDNQLILLLDGLDEVPTSTLAECIRAINFFIGDHIATPICICSRTSHYLASNEPLTLDFALELSPLDRSQIEEYLISRTSPALQRALDNDPAFLELARSPLTLSMMARVYEELLDDDAATSVIHTPDTQQVLESYIGFLFAKFSGQWQFTEASTRQYLSNLAVMMQERGQRLFLIENLQPTWFDELYHREYKWLFRVGAIFFGTLLFGTSMGFAVLPYIAQGMWPSSLYVVAAYGVLGALWGLLITSDLWRSRVVAPVIGALHGGAQWLYSGSLFVGISDFVTFTFTFVIVQQLLHTTKYNWMQIFTIERIEFSRKNIRWWHGLVGFGVGAALIAGLIQTSDVERQVMGVLLGAAIIGAAALFLGALQATETVSSKAAPNEGLLRTLRVSLKIGVILGLALFVARLIGVSIVNSVGHAFAIGASNGLFIGLGLAFLLGGISGLQHLILRFQLNRADKLPRNLQAFLEFSTKVAILQRVGGGYRFFHEYAQSYFVRNR